MFTLTSSSKHDIVEAQISRFLALGRSIAMIWLLFASTVFPFIFVFFSPFTTLTIILGVVVIFVDLLLLIGCFTHLRRARALPKTISGAGQRARGKRAARWFVGAVIFEIVGIILSVNLLPIFHLNTYIIPAIFIFIGLHDVPLGKAFGVPIYTIMGIFWALVAIAVIVFVPSTLVIAGYTAQNLLPTVIVMVTAWIAVAALIIQGLQLMQKRIDIAG